MADVVARNRGEVAPVRDELARTTRHLQSLFDELWGGLPADFGDLFQPLADMEETEDAYVVEVELPGVRKSDITVEVEGRRVIVQAERKERERTGVLRRRTRHVGTVRFESLLPGDVQDDRAEASLDDGVLTLTLPKTEETKRRRIEIG